MAIVYDTGVVDYGVFNNPQVARDAGVASGIYKFNTLIFWIIDVFKKSIVKNIFLITN